MMHESAIEVELTARHPPVTCDETVLELSCLVRQSIGLVHPAQHRAALDTRDEIRRPTEGHRRTQRREGIVLLERELRLVELPRDARDTRERARPDETI